MNVLEHRLRAIRHYLTYPECATPEGIRGFVKNKILPFHLQLTVFNAAGDEEPAYPLLRNSEEARRRFVLVYIAQMKAVSDGRYEQDPDIDPSGQRNHDLLCRTCGNWINGDCRIAHLPIPPHFRSAD